MHPCREVAHDYKRDVKLMVGFQWTTFMGGLFIIKSIIIIKNV